VRHGMSEVERILDQYGLTRDTAADYIDAIVRQNQTQTAAEIGVSGDTVHRYKRAFRAMSEAERSFLLFTLLAERYAASVTDWEAADRPD